MIEENEAERDEDGKKYTKKCRKNLVVVVVVAIVGFGRSRGERVK